MKGTAKSDLGHHYIVDDEGNHLPCSRIEFELAETLIELKRMIEDISDEITK